MFRAKMGGLLALTLAGGSASGAGEEAIVEVRGRVVCVDQEAAARPCTTASHRFALETPGGRLHVFLPEDALTRMFIDERVRERELAVRARKTPSGELETIKVYSTRNGKLYDLDYFCEVCNITAYAPGPCVCCGQPYRLRETPVP